MWLFQGEKSLRTNIEANLRKLPRSKSVLSSGNGKRIQCARARDLQRIKSGPARIAITKQAGASRRRIGPRKTGTPRMPPATGLTTRHPFWEFQSRARMDSLSSAPLNTHRARAVSGASRTRNLLLHLQASEATSLFRSALACHIWIVTPIWCRCQQSKFVSPRSPRRPLPRIFR